MHRTKVRIVEEALDANNTIARANRADFDREGVRVVNFMSAPGAGKTTLLERVVGSADPARLLVRVPLLTRDWTVPLRRELGLPYFWNDDHKVEYEPASLRAELGEVQVGTGLVADSHGLPELPLRPEAVEDDAVDDDAEDLHDDLDDAADKRPVLETANQGVRNIIFE